MSTFPKLTEGDIVRWCEGPSFGRGVEYFNGGAIHDTRRVGMMLKARCSGSQPQPYRVQIALGPKGILAGECSCPVGLGGHCKHAAALLLTWLDEPESFVETEELATNLQHRSKADLIALIGRMIERDPDLEDLLDWPSPESQGRKAVTAGFVQQQVRNAFKSAGDDWDASYDVAVRLTQLVSLGRDYLRRGDLASGLTVFRVTISEILAHYGELHDEDGGIGSVVNDCVVGLGECLAASPDVALREQVLRALFDTYKRDLEFGGTGMGDAASDVMLDQTTPEDRQRILEWARPLLQARGDDNGWRREYLGGFLLALDDALDDEGFLRLCRETGRMKDLVERLLELGRLDEATAVVRSAQDYLFEDLAHLLVTERQGRLAEQLVRERAAAEPNNDQLLSWLQQYAENRGDAREALIWAEKRFRLSPSPQLYEQIKPLATELGEWKARRQALRQTFEEKRDYRSLTQVYLADREVDRAIAALGQLATQKTRWGDSPRPMELVGEVAEAAEKGYSGDAIRLHLEVVEHLINMRGRGNYTEAAARLKRVRTLYTNLGRADEWARIIQEIRDRNRALRALKEELANAGL